MKEFEFLETLAKTFNHQQDYIGDDAVLIDNKYLYAKDILVENIHFLKTTPVKYVIHKLFTSNISDIAAMGGRALYCLLGLAVENRNILEDIIPLLKKECEYYNITLAGGDTSFSKSGMFLSLTVIGEKVLNTIYRNGAKNGDIIFISRPVGLNKISLEKELMINDFDIDKYAHYKSNAEADLGAVLGSMEGITSMTDISDGLSIDLQNILLASGKKAVLVYNKLPLQYLYKYNINHLDYFLSSGEEYSLLFTVEKDKALSLKDAIYRQYNINIIEIGRIEEGSGLYIEKDNSIMPLSISGYEHFA